MAETRYTESHEWCRLEGDVGVVGITQHAADALTDLTCLDLKVKKGDKVKKGQVFGEIESVKSANDLYCPVAGTVSEVNTRFEDTDQLETINKAAETDAWMIKVQGIAAAEFAKLMDRKAYDAHVAKGGH